MGVAVDSTLCPSLSDQISQKNIKIHFKINVFSEKSSKISFKTMKINRDFTKIALKLSNTRKTRFCYHKSVLKQFWNVKPIKKFLTSPENYLLIATPEGGSSRFACRHSLIGGLNIRAWAISAASGGVHRLEVWFLTLSVSRQRNQISSFNTSKF